MKLLIIDDDPLALAVAKVRLSKEGVDICCAEGGRAGLEAARREPPDLIVLDMDMPDLPGFDVCRAMKVDPKLQFVPVIFLTASDKRQDKVEGLDLGAVDYVTKPFDPFELRARVRAALRIKHLHDLLIHQAHIDPLTELSDRAALMDRLACEWDRLRQRGGSLCLIVADMDHFREVNERFGHHVGDQLLREVADAFVRRCGTADLPARYGGEIFAILAADRDQTGALALAERCRQGVEALSLDVDGQTAQCTASFGVAASADCPDSEALFRTAQEALHRAKDAGRNRVEFARNTRQI